MSLQSELDIDGDFASAIKAPEDTHKIHGITKPEKIDTVTTGSDDDNKQETVVTPSSTISSTSAAKGSSSSSWRTKARGLLKNAQEVGQQRAQQKKLLYEQKSEQDKNNSSAAMANTSLHSKESTSSATTNEGITVAGATNVNNDNNDDEPSTAVDMPMSSCDDDTMIQTTGSLSSLDNNGKRRTIGNLLNVARRVDQLRVQQAIAKDPTSATINATNATASSNSTTIPTNVTNTTNTTEIPSTTPKSSTKLVITSETTVNNLQKEGEILTMEEAQKRLIDRLKKQLKTLEKDNKSLTLQNDSLQQKYDQEQLEHEVLLKQSRKEVEERNLKLAVLEQHFIALNDPQLHQDSDQTVDYGNDDSGRGGSLKENDSITSYSDHSFDVASSSSVTGNVEDIPGTATKPVSASEEVAPLPQHVKHGGSIVKLDKSFVVELQSSLKERTEKLENLEITHSKLKETCATMEQDLSAEVEELSAKLEVREQTIKSHEQSIKQLREARFKQKKGKSHQRRATVATGAGVPISPQQQANNIVPPINTQSSEDISVVSSTPTTICPTSEEVIAKAVNTALEKKSNEQEEHINKLKEELEHKEATILKLEGKVNTLSSPRGGVNHRLSNQQRPTSNAAMMRNIAVTNEMVETSIRRLENMTKQMHKTDEKENKACFLDPNQTMLDDDMAPIRRVAIKVSLVHEELKLSLMLIEQKLKNEIKSASQTNEEKNAMNNIDAVTGQSSGEKQDATSDRSLPIEEIQTRTMKMLRETESGLNKSLDALKDQLQSVELEMEGKQDMIEALELACSEHVDNYRRVQEEVEKLRAKVGANDDVEEILNDPASFLKI